MADADGGEDKLFEVVTHLVKTLSHSDSMTDDLLHTFSAIDARLSREKLSDKMMNHDPRWVSPSPYDDVLRSLDRRISRLAAVDELISLVRELTPIADDKAVAVSLDHADDLLQRGMFRLQKEFRTLLDQGGEAFDLARNGDLTPAGDVYSSDEEDEVYVDGDGEAIPVARTVTDYNIMIDALPGG